MQREREGMSDFFRGSGSGSGARMFSGLFGGRNPYDDPFFSRPFGGLFDSGFSGPRFDSSDAQENRKEKGIVIEELDSDHEGDDGREDSKSNEEPSIEHPDDEVAGEESEGVLISAKRELSHKVEAEKPLINRRLNVHSCKVTYGGVNGAYYTSTRTTKSGADGAVIEETKEADKTTGQAQHRISRGIRNKGHSVTRKLNPDGKVDTLQTLHNLNEDELAGFEEAWNSNDKSHWRREEQRGDTISGNRLLPSMEEMQRARWMRPENEARRGGGARAKKIVRINIE